MGLYAALQGEHAGRVVVSAEPVDGEVEPARITVPLVRAEDLGELLQRLDLRRAFALQREDPETHRVMPIWLDGQPPEGAWPLLSCQRGVDGRGDPASIAALLSAGWRAWMPCLLRVGRGRRTCSIRSFPLATSAAASTCSTPWRPGPSTLWPT